MLRELTLVLMAASSACSLVTDAGVGRRERVVAQVEAGGFPGQTTITAPDTVARSVVFPVSFRTYGNSCVEKGDDDVSVVGRTAVVIPYDFVRRGGGVVCDDVGLSHEHVVQLRFDDVGVGLIVLSGLGRQNMPVTFQRAVVVR